jgi:hypothetical protein
MVYKAKKLKGVDASSLPSLGQSVRDLSKYVEDELAYVASSAQATDADPILYNVPPKPRRGTYAYADGVHWNPGAGEGPYFFNGSVWTAMKGGGGSGGIPEAPSDGFDYGRKNAAWDKVVPLSGATMTGILTLSGAPVNAADAATKNYVDTHAFVDAVADGTAYGRLNNAWARVLPLSGGTMTGAIAMGAHAITGVLDPVNPQDAVTLNYFSGHTLPDAPSDGNIYGRKNGTWTPAGGGAGGIYIQDTYPTAPLPNSLWWRSTDGQMFVYYNDGNSSQWVTANSTNLTLYGNVYIQDSAPVGASAGSLWWSSTTGRLYVYYNDGSSIQWVDANPQPAIAAVQYDAAQNLPPSQQVQGRQNIYAAPFDALAYNGMQLNGSMEVSQENGTTVRTTSGYIVDGWVVQAIGTMAFSAAQVADAPPGYTNSVKVSITTAEASIASTDFLRIYHAIEGFRSSRLAFGTANAQPVSIGFWTKIHRAGMYSGSFTNNIGNRAYPFTFTQNAADTWEYKTVTIPGDIAGTWIGNTNGLGAYLGICIAAGSGYVGPAGAWNTVNCVGATGTTNGVAATTDTLQLAGVIVLPGIELPSVARVPFIMRSFDQELQVCKRYFQNDLAFVFGGQVAVIAQGTYNAWPLPVEMRATPTPAFANVAYTNCSGLSNNATTQKRLRLGVVTGGATGTMYVIFDYALDVRL